MLVCPTCQSAYASDARYCPEDGSPLERSDPYLGRTLQGQIEVQRLCGRGAMGSVYQAWQRTTERQVAVKILRSDLLGDERIVRRFMREARAVAALNHPNIITVFLVGHTTEGVPFMVMEYVDGPSLEEVCAPAEPLPLPRALAIGREIALALGEAHAHGIVHRDLKPANILLARRRGLLEEVKVVDFGIAKILRAAGDSHLSQSGALFGTPYYISPEQASGASVDHRADLYALGVILFRMVTGRLPFARGTGMEVVVQHLKEPPPRAGEIVPHLPPALDAAILRALEKDPAARWPTAEALHATLLAIERDVVACGAPTTLRPTAPGPLAPEPPAPEIGSGVDVPPSAAVTAPSVDVPATKLAPPLPRPPRRVRRRARLAAVSAIVSVAIGSALGGGIWLLQREPAASRSAKARPDGGGAPREAAASGRGDASSPDATPAASADREAPSPEAPRAHAPTPGDAQALPARKAKHPPRKGRGKMRAPRSRTAPPPESDHDLPAPEAPATRPKEDDLYEPVD